MWLYVMKLMLHIQYFGMWAYMVIRVHLDLEDVICSQIHKFNVYSILLLLLLLLLILLLLSYSIYQTQPTTIVKYSNSSAFVLSYPCQN